MKVNKVIKESNGDLELDDNYFLISKTTGSLHFVYVKDTVIMPPSRKYILPNKYEKPE